MIEYDKRNVGLETKKPNEIRIGCVFTRGYVHIKYHFLDMLICVYLESSECAFNIRVRVRKCGDIRMVETPQTVDAKWPPY